MIDWIQGSKFIALADFTYSPKDKMRDDYDELPNTLDLSRLKDGSKIYTHTFYAKQLFNVIADVPKKLIIITHNSDVNIDESFKLPENVLKWYSQNVNIVDERIESIPIGLENDRWFRKVSKRDKMLVKLTETKRYRNLVYMNHNISTNIEKREELYKIFRNKPYVTKAFGKNGTKFDQYLNNIYNHKYMICPEGNGLDTHRFWECLYMRTVPIVVKNINNWFYNDLPVLYVNNWEEINKDLLDDMWEMFDKWNNEMLSFEYCKNKINENYNNNRN